MLSKLFLLAALKNWSQSFYSLTHYTPCNDGTLTYLFVYYKNHFESYQELKSSVVAWFYFLSSDWLSPLGQSTNQ